MKQNVKSARAKKDDWLRYRYNYDKHCYEWVRVPLVPYWEYWSIWSKDGHIKLKKTVCEPHRNEDQYGWVLVEVICVMSLVKLDKMQVIHLK